MYQTSPETVGLHVNLWQIVLTHNNFYDSFPLGGLKSFVCYVVAGSTGSFGTYPFFFKTVSLYSAILQFLLA